VKLQVMQQPPAPRERLFAFGADALADVELLAICLGTGIPGVPVQQLASRLLTRFGGLSALLDSSPEQLLQEPGLGPARVAMLQALRGVVERFHSEQLRPGPVFASSKAVRGFLRSRLGPSRREIFACLFLDSRHRLIAFEPLFLGTVDRASVYPREVLRRSLELNAAALILAHNHPSGIAEPSSADIALTSSLRELLRQIDVALLDHLVVGSGVEVSLAERGLL
jgi:DNA repair protein RadC